VSILCPCLSLCSSVCVCPCLSPPPSLEVVRNSHPATLAPCYVRRDRDPRTPPWMCLGFEASPIPSPTPIGDALIRDCRRPTPTSVCDRSVVAQALEASIGPHISRHRGLVARHQRVAAVAGPHISRARRALRHRLGRRAGKHPHCSSNLIVLHPRRALRCRHLLRTRLYLLTWI
jgi:hypothetical protein